MMRRKLWLLTVVLVLSAVGCDSGSPSTIPATQERNELTAAVLLDPGYVPSGPVQNSNFTARGESGPALHEFSGELRVDEFEMKDTIPVDEPRSESGRYFPGFTAEFFTYDDFLVPANREIVPTTGDQSRWGVILSPGKVWSEPEDEGWSRAAFPFVLTSRTSNEVHNGLATFLYNDTEVSQFYFQLTQETAAWNRNDYWGQTDLDYVPGPIANETALRSQFADELAVQLPIRPWSDLASSVDSDVLEAANGGLEAEDISAAGVIMDGAIYLQPSATRFGEYPFPRYMRHGVFSVTKSMAAAVAMLRLAQKYGDDVFELKIADWVTVTAEHDGWKEVTFANALSMATGVGDTELNRASSYITADEDQEKFNEWMAVGSAAEKLSGAFEYGNYPWGPGEVVRYNSITTFVLGAAMDAFLKSKEGPEADIWRMVTEEVYRPIGIFHAPIMRTLEPDGGLGLPIFGYGLYPTVDDTAKITALYHNGGRYEGQQLLSPTRLSEALYQTAEQGLSIHRPNQYGEARYLLSFWSVARCDNDGVCFQVPYMLGYGGNIVLLFPDGPTVFRYADAYDYDPEPLATLGMAVRSSLED